MLHVQCQSATATSAGTIAHRNVFVTASPTARPSVASLSGNHGKRSGQRVHAGISDTDAAAINPYAARPAMGSGGRTSR